LACQLDSYQIKEGHFRKVSDELSYFAAHLLISQGKLRCPTDEELEGRSLTDWVVEQPGISHAEIETAHVTIESIFLEEWYEWLRRPDGDMGG
jgi:hypothetical protein